MNVENLAKHACSRKTMYEWTPTWSQSVFVEFNLWLVLLSHYIAVVRSQTLHIILGLRRFFQSFWECMRVCPMWVRMLRLLFFFISLPQTYSILVVLTADAPYYKKIFKWAIQVLSTRRFWQDASRWVVSTFGRGGHWAETPPLSSLHSIVPTFSFPLWAFRNLFFLYLVGNFFQIGYV